MTAYFYEINELKNINQIYIDFIVVKRRTKNVLSIHLFIISKILFSSIQRNRSRSDRL